MSEKEDQKGPEDSGEGKAKASEPKRDDAGAARKSKATVTSDGPEGAEGELNPSAPGNTGTTPRSNARVG